jgi:hypothetical protein
MSTERRTPSRRRVLKGAKISSHQLGTSTDCTVRNLSDKGAQLIVTSSIGVPQAFELVMADKTIRHCRVAWRTMIKVGITFV